MHQDQIDFRDSLGSLVGDVDPLFLHYRDGVRHDDARGIESCTVSGEPSLAVMIGETFGHRATAGISDAQE